MAASEELVFPSHDHVFLGSGHTHNERRTWFVIALCGTMMIIEIAGGMFIGSIALVADCLDMSAHAGALGDEVGDFHLWRLGPRHLGAIVQVVTSTSRVAEFYRETMADIPILSHLTIEVIRRGR